MKKTISAILTMALVISSLIILTAYPCDYEYNENSDVTRIIRTAASDYIVYVGSRELFLWRCIVIGIPGTAV